MKLTVGPLPAAVYWRRRALVLGAILLAVITMWASCSRPEWKAARDASSTTSPAVDLSPTASLQVPTVPGEDDRSASGSASGSASAAPAGGPSSSVPMCADSDLQLTAGADTLVTFRGAYLRLTLRVKNISDHDCLRDLGADHQELYIGTGAVKIWSSDACDAPKGSRVTLMKPKIEHAFEKDWDGKTTSNGCANREAPAAGKYQLTARLDMKISDPVQITLT